MYSSFKAAPTEILGQLAYCMTMSLKCTHVWLICTAKSVSWNLEAD